MTTSRAVRIACAAVSLTCLMGVAACGGHHKKKAAPTAVVTPPPTTKSVTPKPKPKPKPKAATVDPLTGGKLTSGAVVAVKIDDTANGRPQVGMDRADIVYIEQVEGGLTRTIAVFHSRKPAAVGPVRSVRSNDPELLSQYGDIAFVASGGGGDSLPALDRSVLHADINDRGGRFRRHRGPNLMLAQAARHRPGQAMVPGRPTKRLWHRDAAWRQRRSTGARRGTVLRLSRVRSRVGRHPAERHRQLGP